MQRTLQGQVRQARMIVRPAAERPVEFGICRLDWDIVDGGEATLHQSCRIIFPVLVAIRAKPVPAVVMPFIRVAHRDSIAVKCPQFLDEPIIQFLGPFPGQECDNFPATDDELRSITPTAVGCIGQRDLFRVAAIPTVFREADLLNGGFPCEWRTKSSGVISILLCRSSRSDRTFTCIGG